MNKGRLSSRFWQAWSAGTLTNLGDGVSGVALPLVAVSLTRDPLLVAGVGLVRFLPIPFLALFIGTWLDRANRKWAKVAADLVRAVALALFVVSLVQGWVGLPALYVLALILGVAELVADSASSILIRSVVNKENLERAYSRVYTGMLVGDSFVGPPLGSWLFSLSNLIPFVFQSFLLLISALFVSNLSGEFKTQSGKTTQGVWKDTTSGLRYLWSQGSLRALALASGSINFVNRAVFSILVLYALEVLRVSEVAYGFLSAAFGVGGVVGSLVASYVSSRLGRSVTLQLALVTMAVSFSGLAFAPPPFIVWILLFMLGSATITWGIVSTALRQTVVPDELLGRVGGAQQFLAAGISPVGTAVGGLIAQEFGLTSPFVLAAILSALTVLGVRSWLSSEKIAWLLDSSR